MILGSHQHEIREEGAHADQEDSEPQIARFYLKAVLVVINRARVAILHVIHHSQRELAVRRVVDAWCRRPVLQRALNLEFLEDFKVLGPAARLIERFVVLASEHEPLHVSTVVRKVVLLNLIVLIQQRWVLGQTRNGEITADSLVKLPESDVPDHSRARAKARQEDVLLLNSVLIDLVHD